MVTNGCWLISCFLFSLAWLARRWYHRHLPGRPAAVQATGQRLLHPRTPDDCPACRQQPLRHIVGEPTRQLPVPWCAVKSRRGAPKRLLTDGFACPTPTCAYYRITDAHIHALVGDGTHGTHERIQTFRCQACRTTFSARRDTPLYRLKTPSSRVSAVLAALAEGLDISAAERVFGHHHTTITAWLMRAGEQSALLHDHWFQNLHLPHLQLDEVRTRLRGRMHTLWLWVTIDPLTKIIPVLHLGARTQDAAHSVIHKLRQQLAPDCLPVFTTDVLRLYFYALTAHFGQWGTRAGRRSRRWQVATDLLYGQVKKTYRQRKLMRVTQVMRCGTHTELMTALRGLGLSGRLNTAFIERVNLTIRCSVAALARRTWATTQTAPQLLAQLEWWRSYYHFVRPHASLRVALAQPRKRGGRRVPQRYWQRTPAMAVGLTSRRWTVRELLAVPLPPDPVGAA